MKAISLWQPWATLMAAGFKRVETRSWQPRGLKRGELVAIHAAKRWTTEERELCEEWPFDTCLVSAAQRGLWAGAHPPLGCIVAIARFEMAIPTYQFFNGMRGPALKTLSEVEAALGNYGPNRYGWVFSEVRPLEPILLRGQQGIFDWTPPADIAGLYVEPVNRAEDAERARLTHGLKCERCGAPVHPVLDYDSELDYILCVECGNLPDAEEWAEAQEAVRNE